MGVRAWLDGHPLVLRTCWALRDVAITGPWHPLLLAFCRKYSNNPPISATASSLLPDLDRGRVAARLGKDGWAGGFRLPVEQVDRIVEFTERSPRQRYDDAHRHCEALREIACDATVLEVARRYLGAEPILYSSAIWRSRKVERPEKVRDSHLFRFHFDVADVKSLVLFVYLSDVDEQSGPHLVIPGTHRRKSLWDTMRLYLDDPTAQRRYVDKIRMITGQRGTAFFEEQTTYHKQSIPQKPRLMLAITYTVWRRPGQHRFLPGPRRGRVRPQGHPVHGAGRSPGLDREAGQGDAQAARSMSRPRRWITTITTP